MEREQEVKVIRRKSKVNIAQALTPAEDRRGWAAAESQPAAPRAGKEGRRRPRALSPKP